MRANQSWMDLCMAFCVYEAPTPCVFPGTMACVLATPRVHARVGRPWGQWRHAVCWRALLRSWHSVERARCGVAVARPCVTRAWARERRDCTYRRNAIWRGRGTDPCDGAPSGLRECAVRRERSTRSEWRLLRLDVSGSSGRATWVSACRGVCARTGSCVPEWQGECRSAGVARLAHTSAMRRWRDGAESVRERRENGRVQVPHLSSWGPTPAHFWLCRA